MIFCGIKYTHDAGWTLIENSTLLEHIEFEKMENNLRCPDWICADENHTYLPSLFEQYAPFIGADGWSGVNVPPYPVAPYTVLENPPNKYYRYGPYTYGKHTYFSYPHIITHLISSYCLSPFSKNNEEALVTVWDGGCPAYLFSVTPRNTGVNRYYLDIQYLETLFPYDVGFFPRLGNFIGPRKRKNTEEYSKKYLGVTKELRTHETGTGTFMAYAGLGIPREELEPIFINVLESGYNYMSSWEMILPSLSHFAEEDIMASAFRFFGKEFQLKLFNAVTKRRFSFKTPNLILSGGAALNIKWNSAIRDSGYFRETWVSPIPSDAGSSLGAACGEMIYHTGKVSLDWNVYSGPRLLPSSEQGMSVSLKELASLIYELDEPIVFMKGRSEIGPRALGHRSLLGNPLHPQMKSIINRLKLREDFRPVAPMCIEEELSTFFTPGVPDPYMIFEQNVRAEYCQQLKSILHVDGTSRVQSVRKETDEDIYTLLIEFKKLSGFPILCNTSANFQGKGFFPDLESVKKWGRVRYCWYEGNLYDFKGK